MSFLKNNMQRRFLVLLLGCGFILFFIHQIFEKYSYLKVDVLDFEVHGRFGLILDTQGCRLPELDPYDKTVKHLVHEQSPYVCKGQPVFLEVRPNATLVVNETVLTRSYHVPVDKLSCSYQVVKREPEPKGRFRETKISIGEKKTLEFGVPVGEEFLKVDCNVGDRTYTQYVGLVPIKPEIEKTKVADSKPLMNVVLIGIDSVSKLNFLRHFKKTRAFLKQPKVAAFSMRGYVKVGDNTFPNLTPMLTGHFIEHYWNETVRKTFFFDGLDFIWKDYSAKGYRTMYAEDGVYYGTYQYLKRGFRDPPTDYYFRPLGIAIRDSDLRKDDTCLNNQLETEIFYQYLKSFLEAMGGRPSFSFTMVSSLTHDDFNGAGKADEPTFKILNDLYDMGVMNSSLVVFFSDHGIRFGEIRNTYIGKIEERMPFMYLMLPKWFLDKYPDVAQNVRQNQNRLITLFDVHATLHHLLNLTATYRTEGKKFDTTHLGQSLLSEISEYRTCDTANILPHWCPCQVYQYLPPASEMAKKVAAAIIDQINQDLKPVEDKCERLETDRIEDARVGQASEMVQRFQSHPNDVLEETVIYGEKPKSIVDYLVTLTAKPGGGMFEGTVRHNTGDNTMKVLDISRINMYGKQSSCIDSQISKKFCYCK